MWGDYEEQYLVECDAVYSNRSLLVLVRNIGKFYHIPWSHIQNTVCLAYSLTLEIGAVHSSKMSVNYIYKATQFHIPRGSNIKKYNSYKWKTENF
jgi:hypothetical protein